MVAEGDGLGHLQMGEAGQDGLGLALGQIQDHALQAPDPGPDPIDLGAQVEPHVRGNLVVARASGVQLLARVADVCRERGLYVHVHILQGDGPVEAPGLDALAHALEAGNDRIPLLAGQDALTGQHGGVGDGALDVVRIEPAVEVHRGGECLDEGVRGLVEAPRPGLVGGSLVGHCNPGRW